VRSKEGFGKADAARVGVEEVQVWLEEFLGVGREGILHPRRRELVDRPSSEGSGVGSGRALADGGAEVAAVAHKQKNGDGFESVEQAEHAALPLADGERERFEERAF